ncbi:HNH endonuclease [Gimesia maris]|uniref:HNH endonuclease n=1 Tax=Gimesia maris TaxID=122 RepID=UPI000E900E10|nr:HNH endonuclease [Gimesia maris]HAW27334.1 restriction endonuclease [Planctomycetaceae bacterium]|tara:strand:+ start:44912 stop:45667 length:756 start_codon:yes stop_codon:yes gene_type:complete
MARNWTRDELILAMSLYCRLPFGKIHQRNPDVIQLAECLDRTPSSVAMKLSNLASLDPYHQERGVKGLSGASKADREIWQEFHADWEGLANESQRLEKELNLLPEQTPDELAMFEGETESPRVIKVRRAQRFFRSTVLASYDYQCCVTQIKIKELLIASHIVPWSEDPAKRADPHNGLCLNSLHDKAFDRGLMTLDEDYRLVYSQQIRDACSLEAMNRFFKPYDGQRIQFPSRFRPDQAALQRHRNQIFVA